MGDLTEMVDAVGGVDVNPTRRWSMRIWTWTCLRACSISRRDGEWLRADALRHRLRPGRAPAGGPAPVVQRLVDPETEVDIPQLLEGLHSFETDLSLSDMPTFIELAGAGWDARDGPGLQPRG